MKFVVILSCLIHYTLSIKGQYPQKENYDLERLANEIFPIQNSDKDYSELYENLVLRLSNPIDLNSATDEQLRSLLILSEDQINNFINYRTKQKGLVSKYELQVIPSFDHRTINKISAFVTVHPINQSFRSVIDRILREKNNYFLFRIGRTLENKKGYVKDIANVTSYDGSPYQMYTRFRVARANDFSIGFTLEKDAGESFKWMPDQGWLGFDYSSAHVQVIDKGIFKNIIIGDYQAQFGQGLVLGGGFGAGKGAEPILTIRRSNIGFIPYTSLNESGFLRGVALSISPLKKITVSSFFSYNERDGNISSRGLETELSSIALSGFHRTQTEINNRKSFSELNYGAIIAYKTRKLEIGGLFHKTRLSLQLVKTPRPYNQFTFGGDKNTNLGLFVNYTWDNFTFFGEIATSLKHGVAYIAGVACSLSQKLDLALLHRKYDRNFYTFYGNAFSESSTPQNESGYYIGWKYTFSKYYMLTGYIDFFQFPWLQYGGYAPSVGKEWLLRFFGKPSKTLSFYIQARGESKIQNLPSSNLFPVGIGIKHNYWINCDYTISPHIKFKSRIQFSTYNLDEQWTTGFAIIQDMRFKMGKFSLSLRHAFFDTKDYENRQYVYEQNVWLAYSLPAYYGVGIRNYILLRYTLNKKIAFWVRWSRTYYTDKHTIGSGNEVVEGNSKNDIIFQARIKL